ncbi:MAG: hypothetical protein JW847_00060 [Candidatus Omnitrophica bacterium]|nr:hypothetical protein [Candidatus Omnitrophota bacterium]
MRKFLLPYLLVVLVLGLFAGQQPAYAGSKELVATKRDIFEDDSTQSMRDVYVRLEAEDKQYRQTMLNNSEESIRLLKEIRDLLQKLNEKE